MTCPLSVSERKRWLQAHIAVLFCTQVEIGGEGRLQETLLDLNVRKICGPCCVCGKCILLLCVCTWVHARVHVCVCVCVLVCECVPLQTRAPKFLFAQQPQLSQSVPLRSPHSGSGLRAMQRKLHALQVHSHHHVVHDSGMIIVMV